MSKHTFPRKRSLIAVAGLLSIVVFGGWFLKAYTAVSFVEAAYPVNVWWPTNNAKVSGTQPFKAMVNDKNVNDYEMFWQVDGGQLNKMWNSNTDYPHKESSVDLSSWNWRGTGAYKITFKAVDKNGNVFAESSVDIYKSDAVAVKVSVPATTSPSPSNSSNPIAGAKFFVNPNSNAKRQANEWRSSRPADALQMDKIAQSSEAVWLGGWNINVESDVRNKVVAAKSQGEIPVFIAYNIPSRDCGSYSAGGVSDANTYALWIGKIASGLGGSKAVVVIEPDALSLTECLSSEQKSSRFSMISSAVIALKNAGAVVYIDAGNPGWVSADDMGSRLKSAGVEKANGFALNVSNFKTTQANIDYGTLISAKVGGKHFIIDTARNGNGATSNNEWCNPSGRALGARSTSNTGNSLVDAYLWLKNPGESDGNCNGGPSAGTWWHDYALGLAKRATY